MSQSTSSSNNTTKKKKIELNGKSYKYGDISHLNKYQIDHINGVIDVYAEIPQSVGRASLPSLADQWKEDYRKRRNYGKSPSSR